MDDRNPRGCDRDTDVCHSASGAAGDRLSRGLRRQLRRDGRKGSGDFHATGRNQQLEVEEEDSIGHEHYALRTTISRTTSRCVGR